MGLLRVILALSVALSHLEDSTWFNLAGGFASVQMFYLISGFYMATILTEKYDPRRDIAVFYSNRFLRIYSLYFVALIISLAAYGVIHAAGQGGWIDYVTTNAGKIDWLAKLWLAFTGLFIVGQESTLFMKVVDGGLVFTPDGPGGDVPVWIFMPVPQAWSISLELVFYALVPFLIRLRSPILMGIVGASLLLRLVIYGLGFDHDPWLSRFFPAELALFVLGMLTRRFYDTRIAGLGRDRLILIAVPFIVVTCLVRAAIVHSPTLHVVWIYYALAFVAVPCLFELTRNSKVDRFIGNFSYPLYLIHWIVMTCYDAFAMRFDWPTTGSAARVPICVIASFAVSWLIVVAVETPLDRYRQKRLLAQA